MNYNDYKKIFFNESYLLRYNLLKNNKFINFQDGGEFKKEYEIDFENNNYKFMKADYDENNYILSSPIENTTCILIGIISEMKVAQIQNINGDYENCISFSKEKSGTFLIKLTLAFLEKYKEEFNIKWILTSDRSRKKCGNKFFNLMKLSTLTDGDSWYGKYGFLPVNDISKIKYDKYELNKYLKNKEMINNLKLKDVNLEKYFDKVIKSYPEFAIIKKDLLLNIKLSDDMLLKDYIKSFLIDFKLNCKYFYVFYNDLFEDLGLYNINTLFGKKI